jgi:DNA-binding HxlR family transcriptional regulator
MIGGKGKPIVLFHPGADGILRFSEIRRIIPNITPKMLTRQLRELERDGVVSRKVYAQVPPKAAYGRTELGRSVMPILQQRSQWGRRYKDGLQQH